jgi:hypothetical protein
MVGLRPLLLPRHCTFNCHALHLVGFGGQRCVWCKIVMCRACVLEQGVTAVPSGWLGEMAWQTRGGMCLPHAGLLQAVA